MVSYHERLRKEGYFVRKVLDERRLEEGLFKTILENVEGKFLSLKILPADVALEGESFKPDARHHLVYALFNLNHPKMKKEIEDYEQNKLAYMHGIYGEGGSLFLLNASCHNEALLSLKKANSK